MTHWRLLVFPLLAVILGAGTLVALGPGDPRPGSRNVPGPAYDSWGWSDGPVPGLPPNVILISVDCLRADHLGCYGYSRETSPNIDRLAREGARFEWAIAGSNWTLASHLGMFTSIHWPVLGAEAETPWLDVEHTWLPMALQESGYTTVGFYAGGLISPTYGFDRGFDDYIDCLTSPWAALTDITSPHIHGKVSRWIEEDLREPFFIFIHYWDVHALYIPPPPYDKMFDPDYEGEDEFLSSPQPIVDELTPRELEHMVALYDGEIRWTDRWIGELLGLLDAKGILDSTMIILTADHGEQFGEHGHTGHGHNLHDELVRVPLIVRLPGKVPGGLRIEQQVSLLDIYPTILDVAGIEPPAKLMGTSLAPLIEGRATRIDLPGAFSSIFERGFALRTAEWKVVRWADGAKEKIEFYDLVADPQEKSPLPADHDARSREAVEELNRYTDSVERLRASLGTRGGRKARIDPDLLARLKALGYIK